jgi:predicted transcriptional regulator
MNDCSPPGPASGSSPDASSSGVEARRDELRTAVKRGLAEIEEGRVADLGEALDRIEAMLDELEATKPS